MDSPIPANISLESVIQLNSGNPMLSFIGDNVFWLSSPEPTLLTFYGTPSTNYWKVARQMYTSLSGVSPSARRVEADTPRPRSVNKMETSSGSCRADTNHVRIRHRQDGRSSAFGLGSYRQSFSRLARFGAWRLSYCHHSEYRRLSVHVIIQIQYSLPKRVLTISLLKISIE